jgi:ATP-dependent Clp protease, protease subunit
MGQQNSGTSIHKRFLVLSGSCTEESMNKLSTAIEEINREDDREEKRIKEFTRQPIWLKVDSLGGDVYAGFGLLHTILLSKTPVYTYTLSKAMSMGAMLLLVGHKSYAHKGSTIMIHQISYGAISDHTDVQRTVKRVDGMQEQIEQIILDNTKITEEVMEQFNERREDWFMSAKEAKKYGVVDEYLKELPSN